MPEVNILEAKAAGDHIAVHGTVDGLGYRVTVPVAELDVATTNAEKRRVCARALREEWKRDRPSDVSAVLGKVTLGDRD